MKDDIKIIKKAAKGNKKAFYKLIKEYKDYLYKIAYLQTKYEDDAEKIFEETVYNGFNNIHKLKPNLSFKIWITRILMNEIDYFLESIGMVDREYNLRYSSDDLYTSIDILEPKVKSVIILKYYCNFNIDEISEILDLSPSTVNTFTRRGLKEMKGILSEDRVC